MTDLEPETIEYTGFRDLEPDGVLEQPFYERYNSRLEMPIAIAAAVLVPVAMFFLVVVYLTMPNSADTSTPPIKWLDGEDDSGEGSMGSGGEEALAVGMAPRQADLDRVLNKADINKVKEELEKAIKIDGVTDVDIPDSTAAALGSLHESIREKLAGQKKGTGGPGTGGNAGAGTGPGGTGADSTQTRALRWIIKFDTSSGKDYLDQIAGLGGRVLVQVQGDNKRMYYFKNPGHSEKRIASDADYEEINGWLRFSDIREKSVEAVAQALNLGYTPPMFIVFFPKPLEAKLDKLEREYRGRDPKDIKETVYKVVRKGGEYDLFVIDQKTK